MIHVEYCELRTDNTWHRVSLDTEREADGKIRVRTSPGAVLDFIHITEMVETRCGELAYGLSALHCLGDIVFEDATLLERTFAWMAQGVRP